MKRFLFFTLSLMMFATATYGQKTPSVTVGTGRNELRIKIDIAAIIPPTQVAKLKQITNYEVSEARKADDLATAVATEVERINEISDAAEKKVELDQLALRLRAPVNNLVNGASAPVCLAECARITISLVSQLDYDKTYVLKLAGVVLDGVNPVAPVEFKMEKTAAIVEALNAGNTRKEVRIQSSGPLAAPGTLSLQRKTLRISADGTRVVDHIDSIPVTATGTNNPNLIEAKLGKKLNEAQSHTLDTPANALTDGTGVPLSAKGTIKIPGLPSPPDDPELALGIATNAAVDQKPQFDLDITWAPFQKYPLNRSAWFLQPEAKIDVGLGDTKSDNAITLALMAQYSSNTSNIGEGPKKPQLQEGARMRTDNEIQLRTYRNWKLTPWHRLGRYDFFIGPKMEADRVFRRINALGTVRVDFRFHRWISTIAEKRKLLVPELGELADLVEINSGYRFMPYVLFDLGGHVKNETVENSGKMVSVSVPRHAIFRSHLGLKGLIQWRLLSLPMTLTFDERVMHLAEREHIAYVTDEGVGLRSLRGIHHRGEIAWSVALDPAKHYNFTVTYENGRKAPNFEYLNKVSTGFKIIF